MTAKKPFGTHLKRGPKGPHKIPTFRKRAKEDIERLAAIRTVIKRLEEDGTAFRPLDALRGLQSKATHTIAERMDDINFQENYFLGMIEFYERLTALVIRAAQEEHTITLKHAGNGEDKKSDPVLKFDAMRRVSGGREPKT